jgi:hypothetical protein
MPLFPESVLQSIYRDNLNFCIISWRVLQVKLYYSNLQPAQVEHLNVTRVGVHLPRSKMLDQGVNVFDRQNTLAYCVDAVKRFNVPTLCYHEAKTNSLEQKIVEK